MHYLLGSGGCGPKIVEPDVEDSGSFNVHQELYRTNKASSLGEVTKQDWDEETNYNVHTEGPANNHLAMWW